MLGALRSGRSRDVPPKDEKSAFGLVFQVGRSKKSPSSDGSARTGRFECERVLSESQARSNPGDADGTGPGTAS